MTNVILNALFDNLLMLQPCRENFTLCCKSDIPPIYTYSSPFAPPNFADRLLTRDPGYPHISHILPGTFCHIANSNNGWAWVYNSSCQGINHFSPLKVCIPITADITIVWMSKVFQVCIYSIRNILIAVINFIYVDLGKFQEQNSQADDLCF